MKVFMLLKVIVFIPVFFFSMILLTSCHNNKTSFNNEILEKSNIKNIEFKQWLKDTLSVIKRKPSNDFKQFIKVDKDSLDLYITKDIKIELEKNYNGDAKEIRYALDLLERNQEMPNNKFILDLRVEYWIYVSPAEQLKRNYDAEVQRFIIHSMDGEIEYTFNKGNLISKKIIQPAAHSMTKSK